MVTVLPPINSEVYLTRGDYGFALTEEFFQLSLTKKYRVIDAFTKLGYLNNRAFIDRIVKALAQHSSAEMRENYPIQGERTPHPVAMKADRDELMLSVQALTRALEQGIITNVLP